MFPNILWRPPRPWAACPHPFGAENKGQRKGGCCGDSPPPCNGVRKAEGVSPWLASTPHPSRNVKKETGLFGEAWLAWGLGLWKGRDLMLGWGDRPRVSSELWAKVTPQAGRLRKTQPLPPQAATVGENPQGQVASRGQEEEAG